MKEVSQQIEKREQQRANEDKKRIATLEKKIRDLEAGGVKPSATTAAVGVRARIKPCIGVRTGGGGGLTFFAKSDII